jgi:transcriptional regulator with XRE-family HTH domain
LESFGEIIKNLREEKDLPLRKVAAYLDIDQAVLSKFEHGARMPKREQVIQMAQYFETDENKLLVKWLAQKVIYEIEDDELALEAMMIAEANIKYSIVRKSAKSESPKEAATEVSTKKLKKAQ